MEEYHLKQTVDFLPQLPKEQIITQNYWAAVALNKYHKNSKVEIEFKIDGESKKAILNWDSNFNDAAMKESIDIANQGAIALAWFVMSVLLNYRSVEQTEIGDGVDYRFKSSDSGDDDLNFLNDYHYVEVSGILEESGTNTLDSRIKYKHKQIIRGAKRDEPSSVIITLFSQPKTVKELHK
jgi:hypothetical protein